MNRLPFVVCPRCMNINMRHWGDNQHLYLCNMCWRAYTDIPDTDVPIPKKYKASVTKVI